MGGVRVFRVVARRVVLLHLLPIAFWTVSVVLVLFTVAFLLVAAADLLELVDELGFKSGLIRRRGLCSRQSLTLHSLVEIGLSLLLKVHGFDLVLESSCLQSTLSLILLEHLV